MYFDVVRIHLCEGKQEGAQDTTLWGSRVGVDSGGCYSADSYFLWSVAEEAVYPVDEVSVDECGLTIGRMMLTSSFSRHFITLEVSATGW